MRLAAVAYRTSMALPLDRLKAAYKPLGIFAASQFAERFAMSAVAEAARPRSVLTTA
ncbi:hypothetical protein MESS4_830014 [Mesorhizobium sp. STM 4661]|nr:hypothetical protein MESS4_830014 [Mesorhizobium sp. STM 4661]